MKIRICLILMAFIILNSLYVQAQNDLFSEKDANGNLRLGNDYIVIVVNQEENGMGRFAIETTGGAPFRNNDDNKPLVYGRPKPWTSYTSIWLNNDIYIFGGKTGRRAGRAGKYGEIIKKPYVEDNSIKTVTKFADKLIVEQILTIVKSSTTGLYDSVQIKYHVNNISQQENKAGLRIVLDTMLGENDGAPYRIGKDAVTSDKLYYKKQLPPFWQAFDSISKPNVTSQGAFTGPGITPPDQVKLADWGSLADGIWDFDFNPDEEFLRKGEYVTDSAIAMYWIPEVLKPGESRSYVIKYGLGGITIVPGLLSLGVTSPAEVVFDSPDKKIPIVAYVENTSEITAKNVVITIDLPKSLHVDNTIRKLGDLASGEISQVAWDVLPGTNIPAETKYTVKVEAGNTDSNQVERNIKFIGPPDLETKINILDKLEVKNGRLYPNPFIVNAELHNVGGSTLYDISAEIQLPPGLVLPSIETVSNDKTKEVTIQEKKLKYTGYDLKAGEKINIKWKIKALNIEGTLPLAVDIKALHGFNQVKNTDIVLPSLQPLMYFKQMDEGKKKPGEYTTVDIKAENIQEIDMLEASIEYDPEYLKIIYVSRGNIFMKNNKKLPWNSADLNKKGIISLNQIIPAETSGGTIATLHFKILKEGVTSIQWKDNNLFTGSTGKIEVDLNNMKLFQGGINSEK